MITWTDSYFDFEEQEELVREDYEVITIGFLLNRGPKFLSLSAEKLPEGDGHRAVTHIPLGLVKSERSLLLGPNRMNL